MGLAFSNMPPNRTYIPLGLSICVVGGIAFYFIGKTNYLNRSQPSIEQHAQALPNPTPNEHDYTDILAKLETERLGLASRYQQASSAVQRAALIAEARAVVTKSIYADLFPKWYGTAWDFNGTTQTPHQGKIACGYFVSTVLRDAGWRVERARLAQQASENIIRSLTSPAHIKRFRRVAIGDFIKAVKEWGPGIYVVGLDIHVGFIVNSGSAVFFVHSSYMEPYMVVQETASESKILMSSQYRVLGKIVADDVLIEKWLLGTQIATRTG